MKLSTLFILLFSLIFQLTVYGNCLVDNTKNPDGETPIGTSLAGQQFLACQTGSITAIQVQTSGGDIALYLVEGNGSSIIVGNPYQVFPSQPAGLVTLNLEVPFATTTEEEYAFAIGNVTNVTFDQFPVGVPKDPNAPNGAFSFEITSSNVFTEIFQSDLVFGVHITPPPAPATIMPIPALSTWGLMILGLLIVNLGVLFLQNVEVTNN